MADCTFIRQILFDNMVIGKKYNIGQIQQLVEKNLGNRCIEDLHHKINSVLQKKNPPGYYFYSPEREVHMLMRE